MRSYIIFLLSTLSLSAHPHLFIDLSLDLEFSKERNLKNMGIEWKFDDMNSEIMIMDYDQNGDGEFDEDETQFFKQELFEILMKEYNYYTLISVNNNSVEFQKLFKDVELRIENSKEQPDIRYFIIEISLDFRTIYNTQKLSFRFFDESYMSAFDLKWENIKSNIDMKKFFTLSEDSEFYGYNLKSRG